MRPDLHFSSKKMDWATPPDFFQRQAEKFGPFDRDVCATPDNAKCDLYFTPRDNALLQPWRGVCWMNPPYGKEIKRWVHKAWLEACIRRNATRVVCLLPARTDTRWWHDFVLKSAASIEYVRGRIRFEGAVHNAPFPSAIVVFESSIN